MPFWYMSLLSLEFSFALMPSPHYVPLFIIILVLVSLFILGSLYFITYRLCIGHVPGSPTVWSHHPLFEERKGAPHIPRPLSLKSPLSRKLTKGIGTNDKNVRDNCGTC